MTDIMTYCAGCGGASSPGERFCRDCGSALSRPAPAAPGPASAYSHQLPSEPLDYMAVGHRVDGPSMEQQAQSTEPHRTSPTGYPPAHLAEPGGGYHAQPQAQKQSTNGFAIASMVLGIVCIYGIGSILALVFGYMARKQIDESHGREGGRRMAVAGIALGWVGVGFIALFFVILISAASHSNG